LRNTKDITGANIIEKQNIVDAIIPARGSSKGLPRKNIRKIYGKPLIAYSIEAATECPGIRHCIVSTEDSEIKQVSLDYGVEVVDRPLELATDSAQTNVVVRHVLETLLQENNLPEYFALLQPTSPLRTAGHIQSCIDAFFNSNAACAMSVTETEHHPYKNFTMENAYLEPLFDAESVEKRRQDLPTIFRPNGAIFLMSSNLFLSKNVFFVQPALPYLMDQEASIDIDNMFDLLLAEFIVKRAAKL